MGSTNSNKLNNIEIAPRILSLLYDKAPNSVRISKIYEILSKESITSSAIDEAINQLIHENKIVKHERMHQLGEESKRKLPDDAKNKIMMRDTISLCEYPDTIPVRGEYKIGSSSVIRFLSHDVVFGEDINEITEALVEYADNINKTFEDRIKKETRKIYMQMISIFGVFVSILAIILISTEKMLRFTPDVLASGWWELFFKSSALFLPVALTIGGFVILITWLAKK